VPYKAFKGVIMTSRAHESLNKSLLPLHIIRNLTIFDSDGFGRRYFQSGEKSRAMHSHLKCMFGAGMDGKLLTSFCPYYLGRRGQLRRADTCGKYGVHITIVQDLAYHDVGQPEPWPNPWPEYLLGFGSTMTKVFAGSFVIKAFVARALAVSALAWLW
jgi:hypothetical protein